MNLAENNGLPLPSDCHYIMLGRPYDAGYLLKETKVFAHNGKGIVIGEVFMPEINRHGYSAGLRELFIS